MSRADPAVSRPLPQPSSVDHVSPRSQLDCWFSSLAHTAARRPSVLDLACRQGRYALPPSSVDPFLQLQVFVPPLPRCSFATFLRFQCSQRLPTSFVVHALGYARRRCRREGVGREVVSCRVRPAVQGTVPEGSGRLLLRVDS